MVAGLLPVQLSQARVQRRGKRLLGPVDLTIDGEGFTIVLGPNGAGKTTLLRALHGIERLSGGSLTYGCPKSQAATHQAFVFQTPVMMRRSVAENLIYPLALLRMDKSSAQALVRDWLGRIGLQGAADQQASRLSGGEKQKLALARALIRDPQLLFLDEPCANLDGRSMREIESILISAQQSGTRILMATHDLGQARRLATQVLLIMQGKIIEAAPAETFFANPRTPQAHALLKGDIVE